MSPFTPLSLIGLVSSAITTVVFPLFVWAVQRLASLVNQFNIMESQFNEVRQDVETLKESDKQTGDRLIPLEEAISDIAALRERTDAQLSEIKTDLKQLPRIVTLLEQYGQTLSVIVPRNEVESRLRATEDRLRMVEQDIRNRNKETQ